MERITINPDRIRWACDDRGISPDELASTVKIGASTFGKILGGEIGLTFGQLKGIAKFFNRGLLFFTEPGKLIENNWRTPQFRTLTNQKPDLSPETRALIERAEQHREIYLGLRDELDDDERIKFAAPSFGKMPVRVAAAIARKWLGLGETNDFLSYRTAIEAKGVLVFMAVGYFGPWRLSAKSSIAGFSIFEPNTPLILVKKQRAEGRQVFTLIHELAHLLLHRESMIDGESDLYSVAGRERDANEFAGQLLVPDSFLQRISDEDRPQEVSAIDGWLKPFCTAWGVSGEVIVIRLVQSNRLERNVYAAYRKWRESIAVPAVEDAPRVYRHREPLHLFGKNYVRTVLDAMHDERISLNKASGFLDNLKVTDIRELEKYLARV